MNGWIFLAAWLAAPILGIPFARLAAGSVESRTGRFAFAFGSGAIVLTLAMLALTAVGVPWTFLRIVVAAALPAVLPLAAKPVRGRAAARIAREAIPGLAAAAVAVLLFLYAAGTARATSADFLYFWGTKGQDFAVARAIDVAFLTEPDHAPLHPDYPPLLPCLYALGAVAAGRFPWGAALLSAPVFFALTVAVFWGSARRAWGDSGAALRCALFAALLGFASIASEVVGNAEPPLLFFETLSLGILVFGDRSPKSDFAASIGLAGCALTKLEGAFFALAAAGAFALLRRGASARVGAAVRLVSLPALALGSWLAFSARHGLLYNYRPGTAGPMTFANLPKVAAGIARSASYGVGFLPWIVLLAAWAATGARREALGPALVAAMIVLINVGYYLHGAQDPTAWIAWSARRTFLTPLLCLAFAAFSRAEAPERPRGPIRSGILESTEPEA